MDSLNETPIQRLQREVRELRELVHKAVEGVGALNDLDDLRAEENANRFRNLEGRLDLQATAIRALAIDPAEVAEAMRLHHLRSVDDDGA